MRTLNSILTKCRNLSGALAIASSHTEILLHNNRIVLLREIRRHNTYSTSPLFMAETGVLSPHYPLSTNPEAPPSVPAEPCGPG
jgi:hypothetical protein